MKNNTGTVTTEKNGTILHFNGESFADFRDIPEDLDPENDFLWDLLRANQALRDINDAVQRGMEFIIDRGQHGNETPVPVKDYIAMIESFIAEL